jgi:hypothetical protein
VASGGAVRTLLTFLIVFAGLLVLFLLMIPVANAGYRLSKWLEQNTRLGSNAYNVVPMVIMSLFLAIAVTWAIAIAK